MIMATYTEYEGNVAGIGNVISRKNEMTGDMVAPFRRFCVGQDIAIIKNPGNDFDYSVEKNILRITPGMCVIYGYVCWCHEKEFSILPAAAENYYYVYIRVDKSVVPNRVEVLLKNNYARKDLDENSLRQDVLSAIKTGVFELPLYLFKTNNKGIVKESFLPLDEQPRVKYLVDCIAKSRYADFAEKAVYPSGMNIINESVASTSFVHEYAKKELLKIL